MNVDSSGCSAKLSLLFAASACTGIVGGYMPFIIGALSLVGVFGSHVSLQAALRFRLNV